MQSSAPKEYEDNGNNNRFWATPFNRAITLILACCVWTVVTILINHESQLAFWPQLTCCAIAITLYRKNTIIVMLFAFLATYLYVPKHFFVDNKLISFWPDYQKAEHFNFLSLLNQLYILGFVLGLRTINEATFLRERILGRRPSLILMILGTTVFVYTLINGLKGETLFAGVAYASEEVIKTTLHEYSIPVFLLIAIAINRHSMTQRFLLIALWVVYCAKTVAYGGRIEALQISILVLLLFSEFRTHYKKQILLLVGAAISFGVLVGRVRNDPSILTNSSKILEARDNSADFIMSQQGDVTQSSLRLIGMVKDGTITTEDRLVSISSVAFGFLLPGRFLPESYNLPAFKQNISGSGGGSLISAIAYAWLSVFGPIVIGILTGLSLRLLYVRTDLASLAYGAMVASTFPRWIAYYPIALIKLSLIAPMVIVAVNSLKDIRIWRAR